MEANSASKSSLCIFCLKLTDSSTNYCDYTSKTDQYRFFTLIIRHFLKHSALISTDHQEWCRNACKVISEITINADDNEPFFENVHICTNCKVITRKIADLYHQMKELEIRIDWEVDKLKDLMECADKVGSIMEKNELSKMFTNGGAVTLAEFRDTLKLSCQAYQKTKKKMTVPKVQLVQMVVEEFPLNATKEDIDSEHDDEIIPRVFSPIIFDECPSSPISHPKDNDFSKQTEKHNQQDALSEDAAEHQPETIIKIQEEDPLHPPNHSQNTFTCTTCSLSFISKFKLFCHNMTNHVGKYFSSVKPSALSHDQFSHYISNLLRTTVDSFEKVDEKYKCIFCFKLFSGRQSARNHLVTKHRQILKENISLSQKPVSTLPQKLDSKIITTGNFVRKRGWPKGKSRKPNHSLSNFYCSHCSLSFPNEWSLLVHDTSNHPEKDFMSVKLKHLTLHQFQNCAAHILTNTVNQFQKVDSKYQCSYCSKLLCIKQYAKYHVVRNHHSILKEKLIELQNSRDVNLIMNTSRRTSKRCSWRPKNSKGGKLTCTICKKIFTHGYLFNQHQSYVHPELFFENSNLLPSSSANDEHFKTHVRYILEEQVEALAPHQIKCRICCKILRSLHSAKSHLILRHRILLAEKIENIQKSGKSFLETRKELLKLEDANKVHNKSSAETGSGYVDSATTRNTSTLIFDCSQCLVSFKTKFGLFQHDMCHHIEKYFASIKLKFLPNEQFKKYINYLMKTTVDGSKRINSKYQCTFCSKPSCERRAYKIHLVKMHRQILKEKLMELQQCGLVNLPNPKREVVSLQTTQNNYYHQPTCNICRKIFKGGFLLNQHYSFYHPEIFFENEKPTALLNDPDEKLLFNKYVRYKLEKHVDQEFAEIPMVTLPERDPLEEPHASGLPLDGRDNVKYKCNFCSKALCSRRIAITHLVLKHQRNMAEILGQLKGRTVEEIKLEMMQSRTESSEIRSSIKSKPKLKFNCSLCSKSFDAKFNLFQHELSWHIEKHFLSDKLEFVSNEQFKKCIVLTLKGFLDKFERISSKYQCSFCSKQFSGIQGSRYHLIVKHRQILRDKLVEVQKSGEFHVKVEGGTSASVIGLKRKRGWPKGKSRLLSNLSIKIKFNFKSGNPSLKTKRGRGRPKGKRIMDHVPVFRRQRRGVHKVSRCGGCGKTFANVYTLRTHLKGYCKVLQENGQNLAKKPPRIDGNDWLDDLVNDS